MATDIAKTVKKLIKKYETNDPWKLAEGLNIMIFERKLNPLTKGIFLSPLKEVKQIVINSTLDYLSKRIVLAHEIGHATLHSKHDICFIREYTLFPTGKYEVEANKFAAELLIDDYEKEIFLERGIIEASSYLGVPPKLIEYKFCR